MDEQNILIGLCGIENQGNTCFLNSILQLLLHCMPLISFLIPKERLKYVKNEYGNIIFDDNNKPKTIKVLEGDYMEYIENNYRTKVLEKINKFGNISDENKINIISNFVKTKINESLTNTLSEIVNDIINKGCGIVVPTKFKGLLGNKIPQFSGFSQEDSQEALLQILDIIYEETGCVSNPEIQNVPEELKAYNNKLDEFKKIISEIQNGKSNLPIEFIFEEYEQYKKSFFTSSKHLYKQYKGIKEINNFYKNKYNRFIYDTNIFTISTITCNNCKNESYTFEPYKMLDIQVDKTLNDALNNYIKPEEFECYECLNCNSKNNATKQNKIWLNPYVLFIHIKRYQQIQIGNNVKLIKNNMSIDVPEYLDITDFCDIQPNIQNTNKHYKLKGYSKHNGGLNGGHYTADCLSIIDNKTWHNFNDRQVCKCSDYDASSAYVLMYEMTNENI
jgi:ubiquitin C-terminal hydrolase